MPHLRSSFSSDVAKIMVCSDDGKDCFSRFSAKINMKVEVDSIPIAIAYQHP